jgi:trans-2,3-dihydro-3-hydroxyanthranilate isomerase
VTTVQFYFVDVFAQTALAGNPLALVPAADALTPDTMRAIAREFNQSETTFLVAPTVPEADYRLRSFTPGGVEVLGAGHNAMGAWVWLASTGQLPADRTEFTQQIGDDTLLVRIERNDAAAVRVTMQQSPPQFLHQTTDYGSLADALGITEADLRTEKPAEVVSTGAEHLLVAVTSSAAVDAAVPNAATLKAVLAANNAEGCYLYAVTPERDDLDAYARFFNPTVGIAEDPATGTAAGPLAALLVRDRTTHQRHPIRIEQGRALGRSSILEVLVDGHRVELTGSGLIVAEGQLHL